MRAFATLFLICIYPYLLSSQEGPIQECGSVAGPDELAFMHSYDMLSSLESNEDTVIYIAVNYFLARRTDGSGGLDPGAIPSLTRELNDQYIHAGIQFYPCGPIQFIDSTEYYDFTQGQEQEVCGPRDRPGVMNVYFFNSVKNNSGGGLCGYAYFPGSRRDRIVMSNACALNGSTFIHEVGHFFSLFHTHGKTNNGTTDELVNGSNCTSAGDNICDTPADPNLNGKVSRDCLYTGGASDANGDPFEPDPRNIMSYSRKECRDVLTPGQLARVNFSARFHRPYFGPCCSDTFQIQTEMTEIQCAGDSNGVIRVTEANGFGHHSYRWSVPGDSAYVSNLGAGQYSVTVTDRLGCSRSDTFFLADPVNPGGDFTVIPMHCGEKNGQIILDTLTGRGNITWRIQNGKDTLLVLDSLSSGMYTVHFQDSLECLYTDTIVIPEEPIPFSGLNSQRVRYCISDTLTFPAIELQGEHWTAHWIDSLGRTLSVDSIAGNVMAGGLYFLEIRDTTWGCLTHDTILVLDSLIDIVPKVEWVNSNFLVRLKDQTKEPVDTRRWSVAGVEIDSLPTLEYLSGYTGMIPVCLKLENRCGYRIWCDTIDVEGFVISVTVTDPICYDGLGSLDVTILGDPQVPYQIEWVRIADSTTGNDLINLKEGEYRLMVLDSNGSAVDTTIQIKVPDPISMDSLNVVPSTGMDGSIYMEVSGGKPPYFVEWDHGATGNRVEGLSPGSYSCVVRDGNGCTKTFGPFIVPLVTHTVQWEEKIWVEVSPMPVKEMVSMQFKGGKQVEGDIQVLVYSLSGERIFENVTDLGASGMFQFDCHSWPAGMYILQWQGGNDIGTIKLIKQ